MIQAGYTQLVEKIAKAAGVSLDEIERRVEAKKAKLSDLISKEGAAQIVAAELGVSFDKKRVKIGELLSGMRKISLVGQVIKLFPIRTFKTKGTDSKVASLLIADDGANVRVVLWDTHHIGLIENGKLKEGSVIEIKNASVRGDEIKEVHLGSASEIAFSDERFDRLVTEEAVLERTIDQLKANERVRLRATVVQAFEPRFFSICPECGGKVTQEAGQFKCAQHGVLVPNERAALSLVLDDGGDNIRAVCFAEVITKLLGETSQLKSAEVFLAKKKELLGKELLFTGRARQNRLFNNLEFVVADLEEAQPDALIAQLSQK